MRGVATAKSITRLFLARNIVVQRLQKSIVKNSTDIFGALYKIINVNYTASMA